MSDRLTIRFDNNEEILEMNEIIRFNLGGVELALNKDNGILQLLDKDKKVLSQVDFPTERIIKNIYYNETTQSLVFEFDNYPSVEVKIELNNFATKDFVENKLTSKADLVDGVIPASQLPSYVDDVIEFEKTVDGKQWKENALATAHGSIVFNNTTASNLEGGTTNKYYRVLLQNVDGTEDNLKIIKPEDGKIYVVKTSGVTFRWSGSNLVEISKSLALGETSSTAYAGNKGKANADAIKELQETKADISYVDTELNKINEIINNLKLYDYTYKDNVTTAILEGTTLVLSNAEIEDSTLIVSGASIENNTLII